MAFYVDAVGLRLVPGLVWASSFSQTELSPQAFLKLGKLY